MSVGSISFSLPLRRARWLYAGALVAFALLANLVRAERIPPAPDRFFNDYAGIVAPQTAQRLNQELAQFERDSSNQIVVAIFKKMETESSIEDFTVRIAQSWGVGQKDKRNGAVLFVFLDNHRMRIEVGYGLEPKLTDATCSEIIYQIIRPQFRAGDYTAGLRDGVHAMMAAARGEFQGTGRTRAESRPRYQSGVGFLPIVVFVIIMMGFGSMMNRRRSGGWSSRRSGWGNDNWRGPGGFGGFGGFGGGSSGSGRSGGFSGGGGSFGGGGASGGW